MFEQYQQKIEIQKSTNGINFSSLNEQTVNANGYYDDAYVAGKIFYRLKVTDKNGHYNYSNLVWIDDKAALDIQVYPTVFNNYFTKQNNSNNTLQLQLFNAIGKLVVQQSLKQGTTIVNTNELSKQPYFLPSKKQ